MAGFDPSYKACLSAAHLMCTVCDGPLRKPVVLPCFHAFCSACLEGELAQQPDDEKRCPMCKTTVSPEDRKGLPAVHFLQTLQEVIKSKRFERKPCSVCKKQKYAIWFCKPCEQSLCGNCKETHSKSRGKETHVDFEFLDSSVKDICQRRNDFYCEEHPAEILAYFCSTCSKCICVVCESTRHDSHNTLRLSEKAEELRKDLSRSAEDFIANFQKLKELDERKGKKAEQNKSRLEKELSDWVRKLKASIDQKAKEILADISAHCGVSESQRKPDFHLKWQNVSHFPMHLSDYGSDVEVINLADTVRKRLNDLQIADRIDGNDAKTIAFFPEIQSKPDELVSIGRTAVRDADNPKKDSKLSDGSQRSSSIGTRSPIKANISSSFQAEWDVTGMCVTAENEFLINSRLRKACLVYKPTGTLVREVKLRGQNPFDVTVLKNGNYVLTDREAKKVNVFSPEGRFIETLQIEIGEPGGIAVLSNGDLVICDLKQKDVCVFSPHRKMFPLKSLKTENGNRVFKWPLYVAVNSFDEIIVSDNELHTVKIFDKNGKLRVQYGFYGQDGEKLRGPRGVCTDSSDNIFVSDYTNDRIHMLSPDGKFLRVLIGREQGISGPRVVTMDTNDNLIVGQENATIKIIDCKQ